MNNYLEVTNLSKSFDSFQLHNISFTLPKGYIMGLIGPNGSGKTTTIKLILNMLKRTGGTVKVMGLDNIAEEQKVKSELGVVFDTNYFSDDWKVSQVEKSISVFYPNWDSQKFADMLRKFHIAPTKKVKELSKGMQMKLMLACAFSYDAKLLILDEPTSGLDPVSRDELLKILSEYIEDGEHSVLFSTHITGDLERAADYITYISYGELYFTGSKDDFVDMFRIVKGGIEELSDDLKNKAAGIRTFPTGFEAKVTIMSNILKSTKLDIALVKPYFKTICFTLLLPIVFAAINRSLLTGVSFAMCFIAMTTGYTFSITEKNSMDRLFGILPVRKSELVIGRYVFVLAMGLLSLIISLIAQPLVLKVLGETVGVFDIVTAAIAGVFLFALYTVFQIPGYYKYGSIKGRVFMYIPVAGFLVTLLLLSKMPAIGKSIISIVESSPILLVFLAVFSIVAMYAVSIILSIRIMKKKEM